MITVESILRKIEAGGPGSGRHKESIHTENELDIAYADAVENIMDSDEGITLRKKKGIEEAREWAKKQVRLNTESHAENSNVDKAEFKKHVLWRQGRLHKMKAGGPGSGRHADPFAEEKKSLKHEAYLKKLRDAANKARADARLQGISARGKEIVSDKAKRALANMNIATKATHDLAEQNEHAVTKAVKGNKEGDNNPFDVIATDSKGKKHGIEVKAVVSQKNDKITMKGDAIARKEAYKKEHKLKGMHTVIVDYRNDKEHPDVYHKEGVGSFRIGSMQKVKGGLKGLAAHMKLK